MLTHFIYSAQSRNARQRMRAASDQNTERSAGHRNGAADDCVSEWADGWQKCANDFADCVGA